MRENLEITQKEAKYSSMSAHLRMQNGRPSPESLLGGRNSRIYVSEKLFRDSLELPDWGTPDLGNTSFYRLEG